MPLAAGASWVKLESEGYPCEPGRPPVPDTAALPKAVGGGSCNAAALGESSGSTLKKKCLFLTVNQRNKRQFIDRDRLGSHVESASRGHRYPEQRSPLRCAARGGSQWGLVVKDLPLSSLSGPGTGERCLL